MALIVRLEVRGERSFVDAIKEGMREGKPGREEETRLQDGSD